MKIAKEFIREKGKISYHENEWYLLEDAVEELMIEFAQYHVNKALKLIGEVKFDKLEYIDGWDYSKGVESVEVSLEDEFLIEGMYSNDYIK